MDAHRSPRAEQQAASANALQTRGKLVHLQQDISIGFMKLPHWGFSASDTWHCAQVRMRHSGARATAI